MPSNSFYYKQEKKQEKKYLKPAKTPVQQFDMDGNFISEYGSSMAAGRAINNPAGSSHITAVCRGQRKSAYGYIWKYKED